MIILCDVVRSQSEFNVFGMYIPCEVCEAQQICAGVSFWRWSRFNRNVISVQSLIPAINISKESILIFHVDIHVNKILELCQGVGDRVTEIGNSIHLNIIWKCVWRTAFSWVPRNHIQTSTNYLHKWEIKSSVVSCLSATFFITILVEKAGHISKPLHLF